MSRLIFAVKRTKGLMNVRIPHEFKCMAIEQKMTRPINQFSRAFNLGREWGEISRLAGRFNYLGQKFWTSLVAEPQLLARNFERIQRLNEQFSYFESVFKNIPTLPDLTAL